MQRALSLLGLASAATAALGRTTVSLDFGIRTSPASVNATCSANFWPISLDNVQCQNLVHAAAGDSGVDACRAAACAGRVQIWQFTQGKQDACWIGASLNCSLPQAGWVGGGRNDTGPGASPPEAQPAFDDSAWEVVDTPDDRTIVNDYQPGANAGEAYLPSAVSWYRKKFRVPAAWAGSAITLEVDGSLSTSYWYLNGVQVVGPKPNGYLPLVLRLDTLGLLVGGATNVLTAYMDGSLTTGWWCVALPPPTHTHTSARAPSSPPPPPALQ